MGSHNYKLKWFLKTEAGDFTRQDLEKDERDPGGSDALLFASLLFPPDGSFSAQFFGYDGRKKAGPLSGEDLFRVWQMLTYEVACAKDLPQGPRRFVQDVHMAIAEAVAGPRMKVPDFDKERGNGQG